MNGGAKPALVVLAAGASRRLGRCKALVELTPKTPLELLLAAGACFDEALPLVVTGAHHETISRALEGRTGVELLHNPAWEEGRSGGIRLAARARPGRDLCLAPVDVPLVPAAVFEALWTAWREAGCPERGWLAPRYRGAPAYDGATGGAPGGAPDGAPDGATGGAFGHPILVGRELLKALDALPADTPLRALRDRAEPLLAVDVDAPEILDDLDDPSDLARILKHLG